MPELSGRTENFTDSVIRRMTRVSLQYGAVNLSQGFPDFDPPKEILNRFAEVAHEDYHQYSITWGAQNFREALAEKQSKFMGRSIDPNSEIVVTCGSTEAMMAAMMTVTDPGDKVIVFSPFYENYGTDAILSGAQPIYVPLYPPEFDFNPDELEAAFKQHPKALILCNPSNPCGKVFTYNELKFIADLAEKYDTFVITDEVYEHIVYAPNRHVYFATLPGMWERTISCSSLSKTYSITGWRLGWVCGNKDIVQRLGKGKSTIDNGIFKALQKACAYILNSEAGDKYIEQGNMNYKHKQAIMVKGFKELGWPIEEAKVPHTTFYLWLPIPKKYTSAFDFCADVLEKSGVVLVPGNAFGAHGEGFFRLSYVCSDEQLQEVIDRFKADGFYYDR